MQYSVRDLIADDVQSICGQSLPVNIVCGWTVLCNGEVAVTAALAKGEHQGVPYYEIYTDFAPHINHSAIKVHRMSCLIMQKMLECVHDIAVYTYGDVEPSKYLLLLGFSYIGEKEGFGIYKL